MEEYAAKDFRIKVIHQNNASVSVARNAAYPLLRGQYTLFVDADDWIEPDLCEKAVADREQVDMIFSSFFRHSVGITRVRKAFEKPNICRSGKENTDRTRSSGNKTLAQ